MNASPRPDGQGDRSAARPRKRSRAGRAHDGEANRDNGRHEPGATNPQAIARRVLTDLRRLVRMLAENGSKSSSLGDLAQLKAEVTIELGGDGIHPRIRRRGRDLVAQLEQRVKDVLAADPTRREGSVYCYRCESSRCEHARPSAAQDVFIGYHPTGRPLFGSFATLCLDRCPDRAADLFSDRPVPVGIVLLQEDLQRDHLAAFGRGSRVFEILGQVCVGFFPGSAPRGTTPERHALTIQIVRSLERDGATRVEMHVVARCGPEESLLAALGEADAEMLTDVLREARQRLEHREGQERRGRSLDESVPSFLTWLARGIEHSYRQRIRRTRHAVERSDDADRPTQKALEDARRSAPDRLLLDTDEDTFVVLGARRRAHVFSLAGLHITSLVIPSEDVQRRRREGRWRPATSSEWTTFRAVLRLDADGRDA